MTVRFGEVFHTGYVVPDLGAAMEEVGDALGLRWARAEERRLEVARPGGSGRPVVRFTYSMAPHPPFVELIEQVDGTLWSAGEGGGGPHHLGVWAEDLEAASERLERLGAPLLARGGDADAARAGFAYHRLPSGIVIELVDRRIRPGLERWLAGGELVGEGRP